MEAKLTEALSELAVDASEGIAEDLREEMEDNLQNSFQEAPELVRFMSEVERVRDEFHITIAHPTAPLHERGAYIEPAYAAAMSEGWTRDGFYEALTDCNECVIPKNYTEKAMYTVRQEWGDS